MRKLLLTAAIVFSATPYICSADLLPDPTEDGEATTLATEESILSPEMETEVNETKSVNKSIEQETTDIIATLEDNDSAWTLRREMPNLFVPTLPPVNELDQGAVEQGLSMTTKASQADLKSALQSYAANIGPAKYVSTLEKSSNPSQSTLDAVTTKLTSNDTISISRHFKENPLDKDNYLSFSYDNFISQLSYSPIYSKFVRNYILLFTQGYQAITHGINFTKANTVIGEMSPIARATWFKKNILNSKAYQEYLAALRSDEADENIVTSDLEYLAQIRTKTKEDTASAMSRESAVISDIADKGSFYEDLPKMSPTNLLQVLTYIKLVDATVNQQLQQTEQRDLLTRNQLLEIELTKNKGRMVNPDGVNKIIKTANVANDIK